MTGSALHLRATVLPFGEAPRDLWIVDGRVTFVAPPDAAELAPPGGFVCAGLVDCHTHLYFVAEPQRAARALIDENRRQHLAQGVLLVRDLGATSDEVVGLPDDDGLPLVQSAGRCLVVEPKPPFCVTEPRDLLGRVSEQARAGARWVKIFADWPGWPGGQEEPPFGDDPLSYSEETLAAAVEAAHRAGARVATHAFGREGAQAAVAAGVDSIEHGWGLDEEMLTAMARHRIGWTPMLGIAAPMLRGAEQSGNQKQAAWIRTSLERLRALLPLGQRLGVPVLAGTDWFPSVTLADEVAELARFGLAPADALAAATTAARAFLGVPGLDEGAPADLVVFRDDPRRDFSALRRPAVIVLRGTPVAASTPASAASGSP